MKRYRMHADLNGRIPCNRNARWRKSEHTKTVTCKSCRNILHKGVQTSLFDK